MPPPHANGHPPSRADWLAGASLAGLFLTGLLGEHGHTLWLRLTGLVALAAALPCIIAPFFLLSHYGNVVSGGNYMLTTRVVDRGLYAIVRHPQYLGYSLLAGGFVLIYQNLWSSILGVTAMALFYLFSVQEETYCRSHLGGDYSDYCKRVPRFNALLGLCRHFRRRPDRQATSEGRD
jgi:protein-S-isoprenylcysteine O-methyltransferase Ste14